MILYVNFDQLPAITQEVNNSFNIRQKLSAYLLVVL